MAESGSRDHNPRLLLVRDIALNKLAAVTLEGGLHVWDCSHVSRGRAMAEVRTRVGQCTVWVGRWVSATAFTVPGEVPLYGRLLVESIALSRNLLRH